MSGATLRRRGRTVLQTLLLQSLCAILLVIAGHASVAAQSQAKRLKKSRSKSEAAPAADPNLRPKLIPGEVMRYQVEFQTTSDTKRGGAVQDPEGPSHIVIIWDARIRLEVLSGPGDTGASPAAAASTSSEASAKSAAAANIVRLRTTYEQSAATVQSDSPDPQADAIVKQYQQLEGHSIEFTLGADGNVSSVRGLEGIISDQNTLQVAQQWVAELSAGSSAPLGVVPGTTWSSEQAADALPVAGLVWRTDSTYLRDEPCHPASESPPAFALNRQPDDTCAVILMSLLLTPARSKGNAMPDEFRRNGLDTQGHWAGSGDSLSYVSQRTGWVVSASQSSSQEMDVNITSALGATVHYGGTLQTHSQISLLPPDLPKAPPQSPPAR